MGPPNSGSISFLALSTTTGVRQQKATMWQMFITQDMPAGSTATTVLSNQQQNSWLFSHHRTVCPTFFSIGEGTPWSEWRKLSSDKRRTRINFVLTRLNI